MYIVVELQKKRNVKTEKTFGEKDDIRAQN